MNGAWLTPVLVVLFGAYTARAWSLAEHGSPLPLALGAIGLVLSLWQWRAPQRSDRVTVPDALDAPPTSSSAPAPSTLGPTLWLLALPLVTIAFGFVPAAPLWALCYLRFGLRERWRVAAGIACVLLLSLQVGFEQLAGIALPHGILVD